MSQYLIDLGLQLIFNLAKNVKKGYSCGFFFKQTSCNTKKQLGQNHEYFIPIHKQYKSYEI